MTHEPQVHHGTPMRVVVERALLVVAVAGILAVVLVSLI